MIPFIRKKLIKSKFCVGQTIKARNLKFGVRVGN